MYSLSVKKAIPGQVINAKSTANFGVGAFLLAACEYVRYLEAPQTTDRAYWCKLAYQMAYPVLSNMAKGELQKNMRSWKLVPHGMAETKRWLIWKRSVA